jgi:hypothetical protein
VIVTLVMEAGFASKGWCHSREGGNLKDIFAFLWVV